ncbi:MAG TPA: hypothetical protein C5S51_12685 [Methanosarcinaceae archaeon]|nr:hypothetical protein [Methanosarcinaceae archaeon]
MVGFGIGEVSILVVGFIFGYVNPYRMNSKGLLKTGAFGGIIFCVVLGILHIFLLDISFDFITFDTLVIAVTVIFEIGTFSGYFVSKHVKK